MRHRALVERLRHLRPGARVAELQLGKLRLLRVGQRARDFSIDFRALERQFAAQFKDAGRVFHDGGAIQALAAGGNVPREIAAERLDERKPFQRERANLRRLRFAELNQPRLLSVVQDAQHVVGDAGEKIRVVAHRRAVHVAHVLEAEKVRHLAGRQKRVAVEIAGEKSEAVEGDGVQLRAVRGGLGDGIAVRVNVLAPRRIGPGLLRPSGDRQQNRQQSERG